MICACCGFEISGRYYSVENGKKQICEQCWNNPEIFFPEKIEQDKRLSLLSEMARDKQNLQRIIEIQVIRLVQKGTEMYVGKMKVNDILSLYELDKFKEQELEGYQRERYEERTSEVVGYIEKSPLAVMPAILVGLRETNFSLIEGDLGTLRIERKKGALWIIDGQHRIGGFSKLREQFLFSKSLGANLFSDIMEYELPVVFIDSKQAAEMIKRKGEEQSSSLSAEDVEKAIFFVVNKTQRGISPSLKDALLYSIKTSGIEGLSIVDREGWRIVGAQMGITLNCKETSPLRARINVSGQRNSGKPIQLNSFVSSLGALFKDKVFSELSTEDKISFLEAFWFSIKTLIPEVFNDEKKKQEGEEFGKRFSSNIGRRVEQKKRHRDSDAEKRYLLLTALSIYTLHRIARDLLHSAIKLGEDYKRPSFFLSVLGPVRSFDWEAKTSPLSALGGMKGVSKAYELLSEVIGQEKFGQIADHSLKSYTLH